MFSQILKNTKFPGIDQPVDVEITVSEVKFVNGQMTPQFVISLPGSKKVSLLNSEASFPIPPQLLAGLGQTFSVMVAPMIAKLNADYEKQVAENEALINTVNKQVNSGAT